MSENLFLGDTPAQTLSTRLRCNDDNGLTKETDLLMSEAADRIEQLERELAAIKIQFEYYAHSDFHQADCMIEYGKLKKLIESIQEGK